jgi:ATP-binding cassette, subfamily C, bacteriocin exporter
MKIENRIKKTFVLQKNQSDCGVACLCSIINYHGGESNQEKIRIASGTSKQGTTLLGLYQVANSLGLRAEGMQCDLSYLKTLSEPAILHVIIEDRLQHYVVCYGEKNDHFLIGDPGIGLKWIDETELKKIWKSQNLLTLNPDDEKFVKKDKVKANKWEWFYNFVKEDFSLLITILITGMAVALLGLTTAVFAQVFIDNLIPSQDTTRVFISIGLVTILLFAKSIISYSRQQLMLKQGFDINVRITGNFLTNLFMLPVPFFTTRRIGDMVARLNDIGRIQQIISFLFGELLINVLVVIVSLTAVFIYNYWIGFVLLAGIPLLGGVAWRFQKPVLVSQRELMASYALNESNYINTIVAIQPVKSFKRERFFTKTAISVFEFFQKMILNIGKIGASVHLYSAIVSIVITVGIIGISAIQMLKWRNDNRGIYGSI